MADDNSGAPPGTGVTPPPDNTTNGGGFNFSDFIKGILNAAPGSDGSNPGVALAGPAMGLALKQWLDASKYQDTAKTAADMANPFGDRSFYRDRLRASYDDPSAILNDPGHQIQVKRGLDQVAATGAMNGYMGSTNMGIDLSKYASDSDATYLDQERQRLGNLAGAQFDPANGAGMLMKGNDQMINSQNSALSTLMLPFLANFSQNRINNNGNGNPNNSNGGNIPNPKNSVANIAKGLNADGSPLTIFGPASQWIQNEIRAGRTVDPNDPHIQQAIQEANDQAHYNDGPQPDNPYGPNPNTPSPPPDTGGPGDNGENPWWQGGSSGLNQGGDNIDAGGGWNPGSGSSWDDISNFWG